MVHKEADKTLGGSISNPIRVSSLSNSGKSFKEMLANSKSVVNKLEDEVIQNMKPLAIPQFEGDNLVVDLDEDDYNVGIEELQFSVVGHLFLSRGSSALTTMSLRANYLWLGEWRTSRSFEWVEVFIM